jgi:uncharacterized membrane protein
MPVIDETVTIDAPLQVVFDYLVDGQNLPAWDASITECVRIGPGPIEVGTRYRGASKIMGRRIEWTTEVIDLVPGVRAASRSVEGSLRFTIRYEFAETPEGTSVRYLLTADSGLGGAFGRVMEPLVEKAQTKVVRANLATVARHLELRKAV